MYLTIIVGYGDITPRNPYEIICAIIVILFGCAFYAYNINEIGFILTEFDKTKNKFK